MMTIAAALRSSPTLALTPEPAPAPTPASTSLPPPSPPFRSASTLAQALDFDPGPRLEAETERPPTIERIPIARLSPNSFSLAIYGEPSAALDDLLGSVRDQGILVPLVVAPREGRLEIVSGHRRFACAKALGLEDAPCQLRDFENEPAIRRAVLEYNRQRRKTFSQMMREADALEDLLTAEAHQRRLANLKAGDRPQSPAPTPTPTPTPTRSSSDNDAERRNSDRRGGRTDETIAKTIGLGGKDLYRQARAVWKAARQDDIRAADGVRQLDAGVKTIHAAYKDLRRRGRFAANFRPTPYDVWSFRHDSAFGIPHPGSIPPSIVAHLLHYYTAPDALVVDPMAGGGVVIDVCQTMGRRCLAYDLDPVRPDVRPGDVQSGLPKEAQGCDLIFCDPPYHTMLAHRYVPESASNQSLSGWLRFLDVLARNAFKALREGGHIALLLANQTEKDLPAGFGYIDHAFFAYQALTQSGFAPERRVSCPMSGNYLPQHVKQARRDGRMLGVVRDLLIMRKPKTSGGP